MKNNKKSPVLKLVIRRLTKDLKTGIIGGGHKGAGSTNVSGTKTQSGY